jgi:excisionase family DNA binding protein
VSDKVYTVEQFAELVKLHPKTVLRFIKEGRVRAVKVGRSYRILRSELEAMTGLRSEVEAMTAAVLGPPQRASARVTSIVDIPDIDPEAAKRLARLVPSVRMGRETPDDPMSLDIAYDQVRSSLKVVIVGSLADTSAILTMIKTLTED